MVRDTISHYRILAKLGEGSMGVVYKAEDVSLGRTVVLRFLRPDTVGSDQERARLIREAQAAARLDHPNVCTIHEIDTVDGETFVAMAEETRTHRTEDRRWRRTSRERSTP